MSAEYSIVGKHVVKTAKKQSVKDGPMLPVAKFMARVEGLGEVKVLFLHNAADLLGARKDLRKVLQIDKCVTLRDLYHIREVDLSAGHGHSKLAELYLHTGIPDKKEKKREYFFFAASGDQDAKKQVTARNWQDENKLYRCVMAPEQ